MFGINKLVNFVDLKMLKQSPLGNRSTMGAQLGITSLDALVRIALKSNEILLDIQCDAYLTLLGLHKQFPIVDVVTTKSQYILCQDLATRIICFLQGSTMENIVDVMQGNEANDK